MNVPVIHHWRRRLASGHTETWLATMITLVAIGFILVAWWLVSTKHEAAKYALAGMLLYLLLP